MHLKIIGILVFFQLQTFSVNQSILHVKNALRIGSPLSKDVHTEHRKSKRTPLVVTSLNIKVMTGNICRSLKKYCRNYPSAVSRKKHPPINMDPKIVLYFIDLYEEVSSLKHGSDRPSER